jgi:hypothetical protein
MAALPTTFATLVTAVGDYLNKKNLSNEIEGFVRGAESDLSARLRDRRMVKTTPITVTGGHADGIPLPADWVEMQRVSTSAAIGALRAATLDEAAILADSTGNPSRYVVRGAYLDVLPKPAVDVVVTLVYYAAIPNLTNGAPTNWLLEKEPLLYIYASCLHAAPFLVDDERVPTWTLYVNQRVDALNDASKSAAFSGSPLVRRRHGFW